MLRMREQRALVGQLDDLAQVHHGDAVADVLDHGEVVRDEQVRELHLVLQVHQEVDHLRLHRHVERRHRLVAHDQPRPQRERAGDAEPLALAAGEFVRILDHLVGAQADLVEQRRDALVYFGAACALEIADRLADDVLGAHPRIERRIRILEHCLQLAPYRPHCGRVELIDPLPAPFDRAAGRIDQFQHRAAGRRFAAAAFADETQRLAG